MFQTFLKKFGTYFKNLRKNALKWLKISEILRPGSVRILPIWACVGTE